MDRQQARRQLEEVYPILRQFAAVVGPPDVEPDDLVQEAFVRALRRGLDSIDDLLPFLRRVIVNLSSTERRQWRRRHAALARTPVAGPLLESSFADVAELLRLPAEVRAVLWLAEVEGWSYSDIGQMLGCGEAAARARASRGRRRLRVELAEEAGR